MNKKNQAIAFTAFNMFIALLVVISLFFVISASVSSPGKFVKVCIVCDETGDPVPAGLDIFIKDASGATVGVGTTGADGCTGWMGSGFPEGTYTIAFWWNGEITHEETITCAEQYWTFTYRVPNPIIHKTFLYDLPSNPPVVDLYVELHDADGLVTYAYTDASGMVTFGGDLIEVCKDYWLKWTWNGALGEHGPIHFAYVGGELLECEIWITNYLEPKGGGDK